MSSTSVAQQPLNFGPEWLRALSTPESTTPIPASGGSGSGNIFKFSATKYRYSKDEILALRSNVTERLAEDIRNEILENLKDVESVFRPNIIEPLTLTTPSAEESAKMNSLSSYISGRTPGGGGRGGNNSQQSQQQDSRINRGGGSVSNGRIGSRGRGGRENNFGPNRGNNNPEDNGENGGGGAGDDTSVPPSSWSSRGGYHSRGGGSFQNRVRSYDDREQSQSFRRGGGTRQTADGWRRSRGDDEENNDQNEDTATPANGSASWTSRGGPARRGGGGGGGGNGSLEYRTKSNDKWNYNDDRPGPSNSYESNQPRGWRSNATISDRDLNSRRPPGKRDRMPEWMDDNNDDDNQLSNATFEKGTFTGSSSNRQNNNSNEKFQSQTSVDEQSSRGNVSSSKQQDDHKSERLTSSQTDKAVINIPTAAETITKSVPEPTPPIQHTTASWDDEFEPSDVATTVVESTLAEDHDYSPPISTHPTPHPISMDPTASSIPQQQRTQPAVVIDDKQWFYKDPQNTVQGPFSSADMERWFTAGYFTVHLPVKRMGEKQFSTIQQLTKELGRVPFRTDVPSLPSSVQQQQSVAPESQKFNLMPYAPSSTANNAYIEEYLMQQQSRQNVPHSMLFNRQTSVPSSTTDRKPVTSPPIITPELQAYFASQQQPQSQSSSSLFSSNLVSDPAIVYQQQQPQLQRSISATNQQQPLFDDIQRSFHQLSSQTNPSSFFGTNISGSQSQKPNDIMTRLAQAMQSHGQQQQEKVEEQRRFDQQRRELEMERSKLTQQAEQIRLQREEDERRQLEQQQRLEEELRKKKDAVVNKQMIFDQMKEMAKTMDQKKQQQQQQPPPTQVKPQTKPDIDPFLAFQQSLQFQKEQQSKIDAQKAENVRRFQQQQSREQTQQQQQQQQQQTFKLPETANWARHPSQTNDQNQPLNFAEIQKQEQEQERRAREAAMTAQQLAKSEALNIPNPSSSSSSTNKPGSWARTLFTGSTSGNINVTSSHIPSDHDLNESPLPGSPITSYNQQATNAPKSRSATNQQTTPWSATNSAPNTSLQDIQRQQSQNEPKQQQQPQQQPQQQQVHQTSSGHSTPAWGGIFQHSTPSPQSSSSIFWGDNQHAPSTTKPASTSTNKSSTPWTELKSSAPSSSTTKANPTNFELTKSEREAQCLFTTTRTQDALSKWTQTQFKDNLQAIDVPTLVQLLKDIDTAEEIVEYVQPYIGSVIKAKEFANDFIVKRKQLSHAEPELDNERLNELAMAPTSLNPNSGNNGDEGFQLASSNGQKKKAKKMKGQKIDVKQLGFMVNNRPEQRDDIDKVPM